MSRAGEPNLEPEKLPVFTRRQKMWTTVGIYFGNICNAIGMNAYAPAVIDFRNKYDVNVDQVAIVFTILTVSYMMGALLTSFIYNYMNRQLGVTFGLTGIGTALFLTPHCPSLTLLYVVAGLLGLCNGIYHSAGVVWVIEMWQPAASPFIQGQHFFQAVGYLVPSILLGRFLTNEGNTETLSTTAIPSKNKRMWIPFTIVGILTSGAALIQAYLFVFQRYIPRPPEVIRKIAHENEESSEQRIDDDKIKKGYHPKFLKIILIVLSAIFLGFYQGMEMVTMQFISTFAQFGGQNLSEAAGASVMTALTVSFAVARGIGFFASVKIKAQFILFFNLVILFASSAVLLVIGNSAIGLWAGVGLLGVGFSTIYPSFCAYIVRHLEFTNTIGSVMLVAGSVVGSIFPVVIGQKIEQNPTVLTYVNLFSISLITVVILIILKLTYNTLPSKL